jgi:hypothetical protein
MRQFGTLDIRKNLIDRDQRLVKLGPIVFDVAKRELDRVQLRPQRFVAPADRESKVLASLWELGIASPPQ